MISWLGIKNLLCATVSSGDSCSSHHKHAIIH